MTNASGAIDRFDRWATRMMAAHGVTALRVALGIVFLWFGALKLLPCLGPAEDLAARTIEALTFGVVPPSVALPVLALWEVAIGVGLLVGRWMRVVLLLLFVQMLGTVTPLVLFPAETWLRFPISPTLEGQYIIKNIVLVTAAIVLGATVRGGQLSPEPVVATQPTTFSGKPNEPGPRAGD
ncbi:DoxX family protein [soil metagenome]